MMTCACAVASGSISPGTHEPASVSKVVLEGCAGGGIKGGDREDCGLVGWTAQARWAAFLADGTQQKCKLACVFSSKCSKYKR